METILNAIAHSTKKSQLRKPTHFFVVFRHAYWYVAVLAIAVAADDDAIDRPNDVVRIVMLAHVIQ